MVIVAEDALGDLPASLRLVPAVVIDAVKHSDPRHDHRRWSIVAGVESRATHDAAPLFRRGNTMLLTPRHGNLS